MKLRDSRVMAAANQPANPRGYRPLKNEIIKVMVGHGAGKLPSIMPHSLQIISRILQTQQACSK